MSICPFRYYSFKVTYLLNRFGVICEKITIQ